eukprot:4399709-Lingulodinium_polyedra.AAC.1
MEVDHVTDSAVDLPPMFPRINAVAPRTRELKSTQINVAVNEDPQEAQGSLHQPLRGPDEPSAMVDEM